MLGCKQVKGALHVAHIDAARKVEHNWDVERRVVCLQLPGQVQPVLLFWGQGDPCRSLAVSDSGDYGPNMGRLLIDALLTKRSCQAHNGAVPKD